MDLNAAVPHSGLASTGYCLAQPGAEYLVYQPGEGRLAVHLEAGTYQLEWHDPSTGEAAPQGPTTVGVGACQFTPPFADDAVLYLRAIGPRDPLCAS